MSQITSTETSHSLAEVARAAVRAGAPEQLARLAQRVTSSRFRIPGSEAVMSPRAEAYFWGIIRRRALRGAAPVLADGLLAMSLAAELSEAGHSQESIERELMLRFGRSAVALSGTAPADGWAA